MQGCLRELLLLWVLRSCSVPTGMKALMDGARAWLYWAKNPFPHKHADYLGGWPEQSPSFVLSYRKPKSCSLPCGRGL